MNPLKRILLKMQIYKAESKLKVCISLYNLCKEKGMQESHFEVYNKYNTEIVTLKNKLQEHKIKITPQQ